MYAVLTHPSFTYIRVHLHPSQISSFVCHEAHQSTDCMACSKIAGYLDSHRQGQDWVDYCSIEKSIRTNSVQ